MEVHQTCTQDVSRQAKVPYCFWEVKVKGQCHERSKGQKLWSAISRKLLTNKDQNVQLVKGFPPICLVLKFHFRSKSSPEVKGKIHIFDHNSKTIDRIDLKQRPLDSSRRAAQNAARLFFVRCTVFEIFGILCFLGFVVFGPGSGCGSRLITCLSAQ